MRDYIAALVGALRRAPIQVLLLLMIVFAHVVWGGEIGFWAMTLIAFIDVAVVVHYREALEEGVRVAEEAGEALADCMHENHHLRFAVEQLTTKLPTNLLHSSQHKWDA